MSPTLSLLPNAGFFHVKGWELETGAEILPRSKTQVKPSSGCLFDLMSRKERLEGFGPRRERTSDQSDR